MYPHKYFSNIDMILFGRQKVLLFMYVEFYPQYLYEVIVIRGSSYRVMRGNRVPVELLHDLVSPFLIYES